MCRFLAYKGRKVLLEEVLYLPKNSLIKQSAQAHESEEPLNGDGFGVGWYTPEITATPGLFVSVRPAWNDRNLRYLCKHIQTSTFFAHVRAASEGEVSEANCHPFQFKHFLFMHNGGIGGFARIKRQMRRRLSDETYDWVRGQTDSEHLFALFLENLPGRDPLGYIHSSATSEQMALALEATIRQIQEMKRAAGITEDCYINCAISNGDSLVTLRYVSNPSEKASTLYYSEGQRYECEEGICRMIPGRGDSSVLIVSEKLTANAADWKEIPTNHLCIVDEKMKVHLTAIDDGFKVRSEAAAG